MIFATFCRHFFLPDRSIPRKPSKQCAELLKQAKEQNATALTKANDLLVRRQAKDTDVNKGGDTDAVTCKVCRDAIGRSSGTRLPAWAKDETPAKYVLVVGDNCPTEETV